jgi:hypothetical protein
MAVGTRAILPLIVDFSRTIGDDSIACSVLDSCDVMFPVSSNSILLSSSKKVVSTSFPVVGRPIMIVGI